MLNHWPSLRGKFLRGLKPSTCIHIFLTNAQRWKKKKVLAEAFVTQTSTKTSTLAIPISPSPNTTTWPAPVAADCLGNVYFWYMPEDEQQLEQSGENFPWQSGRSILFVEISIDKQSLQASTHWWMPQPGWHWIMGTRATAQACGRRGGRGR